MPRAHRYFLPDHVWHITLRCHRQAVLLQKAHYEWRKETLNHNVAARAKAARARLIRSFRRHAGILDHPCPSDRLRLQKSEEYVRCGR